MNVSDGRESRGMDGVDMDFHRDTLTSAPAAMDLFNPSKLSVSMHSPDRNPNSFHPHMQTGSPGSLMAPVVMKATGEATPAAAALSKRPDSIMSTAKQIAKAMKPATAARNARIHDMSKTNGAVKHVSGVVSPTHNDASLQSHHIGKQSPVEIRPIQPAVSQLSPQALPIAYFCHQTPLPTQQGASVAPSPMLFMQQENGSRFQAAAISLAPIQSSAVHSPTGLGLTPRFSIPPPIPKPPLPQSSPKPRAVGVKMKQQRSSPAKWSKIAAIKPDLKPKPSLDGVALHVRAPSALDMSFTVSPAPTLAQQKRVYNGEEPVTPRKRQKKKYASDERQLSPASLVGFAANNGLSRVLEAPLTSHHRPTSAPLPGIAAMMPQSTTSDSAMFPAQDTASSGSAFPSSDAVPLSADPGYYAKFSPALPPLDSHGAAMKVSVIGGHAELPIITPIHAATTLLQPHLHTTTLSSSPNRQDSANENDSGTDLFCRDSPPGLVSPPLPPAAAVLKPVLVGHSHETENGAFRKKTRLIYDSGVRKFQQINHETVGGGEQQHTVNGTDLRTSVIGEKPVLIASNTNRSSNSRSTPVSDSKPAKKARKPRSDKGISPRLPKVKKEKAVVTTTKIVPVTLELKRSESEEQTAARMKRLAGKWPSISEDGLRWLVATKGVDQLRVVRWLRLVDRAFMQAESAKNFEKMEILRDSKIQAIMDLEKLQAPFEPRLFHFLHPDDQERKMRLLKKYFTTHRLSAREALWLKGHYRRLGAAEKALPGFGATTQQTTEKVTIPAAPPATAKPVSSLAGTVGVTTTPHVPHPGNERGNFQIVSPSDHDPSPSLPSTSALEARSFAIRDGENTSVNAAAVQAAHQFVRKFPDSTKAVVEVDQDGLPCAVLLLIQQPNCKAVHIKKTLKRPQHGFRTMEEAFTVATAALDHLVMKFLCVPAFPMLVRYPIAPTLINDHISPSAAATNPASVLSFNRHIRSWETIQYVENTAELGGGGGGGGGGGARHPTIEDTVSDQDFDLANDAVAPVPPAGARPSLLRAFPIASSHGREKSLQLLGRQIAARQPVDLTAVANDPVEQRRWLCWELRHVSQQYFHLDSCQQAREKWYGDFVERLRRTPGVPDVSLARALHCEESARDGAKKPKASTTLVNRMIKMGEQVRDVLESYRKERPMTRRKKAKMAASQLA